MAISSEIKEHMEVLGSDGEHVGTVDHVDDDDMIKLTHTDAPDGKHHYLPLDLVDHVDEQVPSQRNGRRGGRGVGGRG